MRLRREEKETVWLAARSYRSMSPEAKKGASGIKRHKLDSTFSTSGVENSNECEPLVKKTESPFGNT